MESASKSDIEDDGEVVEEDGAAAASDAMSSLSVGEWTAGRGVVPDTTSGDALFDEADDTIMDGEKLLCIGEPLLPPPFAITLLKDAGTGSGGGCGFRFSSVTR
jgi:hypothetical protein